MNKAKTVDERMLNIDPTFKVLASKKLSLFAWDANYISSKKFFSETIAVQMGIKSEELGWQTSRKQIWFNFPQIFALLI